MACMRCCTAARQLSFTPQLLTFLDSAAAWTAEHARNLLMSKRHRLVFQCAKQCAHVLHAAPHVTWLEYQRAAPVHVRHLG